MTVAYDIAASRTDGDEWFGRVGTTPPTVMRGTRKFIACVFMAGCAATSTLSTVTPADAIALNAITAQPGTLAAIPRCSLRRRSTSVPFPACFSGFAACPGSAGARSPEAVGVSRRTIHNWLAGARVAAVHHARLLELGRVVDIVSTGSVETTRTALMQPTANGRSILDDLALAARPARTSAALKRLGGRSRDAGGRDGKRQPATPAASQFAPRRVTAQEATGRVMTQLTLIESALQRAAVVSSLLQGEVLGVADACVVLAEASAPLSAEAADIAVSAGTGSGLIVVPHAVDDVVLLTQTCDLQFTTAAEHRCLVAPVMHVSEQVRVRGIARPSARVRGVALGRFNGRRRPVSHYYRRAQRTRRCCKPGPAPHPAGAAPLRGDDQPLLHATCTAGPRQRGAVAVRQAHRREA